VADVGGVLERGREFVGTRDWPEAYEALSAADRAEALSAADLELLGTAAYMIGREDEWLGALERAHAAHLDAGEPLHAVRCAFWVGMNLALRGDVGPATGWLGRAQRLLDDQEDDECVERGYLLLPVMFRHEAVGDLESAAASAAEAVVVARRFDDADLFALAIHSQGQFLIRGGDVKRGLGLLDESMVSVTSGSLSPIVTGLVYCGVILACQEVFEVRRAREWTDALSRWCAQQPGLVAFTGRCLMHRAELMQLDGAWREALEEARQAGLRFVETTEEGAAGLAYYRQGELQRLLGRTAAAEAAYRAASRQGREPQPGLALLRLRQGRDDAAAAAIRRAVDETEEPLRRAELLPAQVEVMLAVGDLQAARAAESELREIAARYESTMLDALAAQWHGAVELADGRPAQALVEFRRAWRIWRSLEARYDSARTRVQIALACRALGDDDAVALEADAARETFVALGARPDIERLDDLFGPPAESHGLTARELEVLRLVAEGRSNREIAAELVISEHTVARHVQNILTKLRLPSRTAATAFAFEHGLV
jgi:DNA-binding CsgD family transcriptional regulator/tetratricopeptide (TPR) repeat protein